MEINKYSLGDLVKESLQVATNTLEGVEDGTTEVFDERVTDISTKGDRAVSKALIDFFKSRISGIILTEEYGKIIAGDGKGILVGIDDIDATDNYFRGQGMLPNATVIQIFETIKPQFKDALVAGVIEHNSGTVWMAIRGEGLYQNGKIVQASQRQKLDRRTLVIIDNYISKGHIAKLKNLNEQAWIKDFGCAALHWAGVGSGMFDAFVSALAKGTEAGAGYLFVKEGKGTITNWQGKPIDDLKYDFEGSYDIIAAGTQELADSILQTIK